MDCTPNAIADAIKCFNGIDDETLSAMELASWCGAAVLLNPVTDVYFLEGEDGNPIELGWAIGPSYTGLAIITITFNGSDLPTIPATVPAQDGDYQDPAMGDYQPGVYVGSVQYNGFLPLRVTLNI